MTIKIDFYTIIYNYVYIFLYMKETIKSLRDKIKKYNDTEDTTENEDNQATVWKGQIYKIISNLRDKVPESLSDTDYKIILVKIGKTIFTEEELNKELKKYKSEPATKKPRKSITIDNGIMQPTGFSKKEKDLVRLIEVDKYTDDTIIEIMKGIGQGKIKKVSGFPEPDNKPEPEPKKTKAVEPEPKKTKGGVRPGAGRKPKAVEPKPLNVVAKKRGPKPKSTAGQKAQTEIKKNEDKDYTDKEINTLLLTREDIIKFVVQFPEKSKGGENVELEFVKKSVVLKN